MAARVCCTCLEQAIFAIMMLLMVLVGVAYAISLFRLSLHDKKNASLLLKIAEWQGGGARAPLACPCTSLPALVLRCSCCSCACMLLCALGIKERRAFLQGARVHLLVARRVTCVWLRAAAAEAAYGHASPPSLGPGGLAASDHLATTHTHDELVASPVESPVAKAAARKGAPAPAAV